LAAWINTRFTTAFVPLLGWAVTAFAGAIDIAFAQGSGNTECGAGDIICRSKPLVTPNPEEYCKHASPRETVIYVDRGSLKRGSVDWIDQLRTNLAWSPRERVSVVLLDGTGQTATATKKVTGCFPAYSRTVNTRTRKFDLNTNALELAARSRGLFENTLWAALADTVRYHGTLQPPVPTDLKHLTRNQLAEALLRDTERFEGTGKIFRIILYSFGGQQSKSFSLARKKKTMTATAKESFGFAEVFVFGVGSDENTRPQIIRRAKRFWRSFFSAREAHVAAITSAFQPDGMIREESFDGVRLQNPTMRVMQGGMFLAPNTNKAHPVELRFAWMDTGKEVFNSWLVFPKLDKTAEKRSIPFTGKIQCESRDICHMRGEIKSDLGRVFLAGDPILLRWKNGKNVFLGRIKGRRMTMYDGAPTKNPMNYGMVFGAD
jgi:hypothetical protein